MQYLEKMMFLHLTEEAFDTGFYLFKTTIDNYWGTTNMWCAFSNHLSEIGKE